MTGTMLLGAGLEAGVGTAEYADGTAFMAAVSAACIVPPLVTSFAVIAGKKYFSQEDHDAGIVNIILGCTHITEGAIPFMTKNIWPVMPITMLSAAIASVLTLLLGVHVPAPHGGFLVLPVVDGGLQWVLAILAGTVVGGILFTAFKKAEWTKAQREATAEVAVNDAPAPVDATAEAAEAPAEVPVDADDSEGFVKDSDVLSATDLDRDGALKAITAHAVEAGIASDSECPARRVPQARVRGNHGHGRWLRHPACQDRCGGASRGGRAQGRRWCRRVGYHGRRSCDLRHRPARAGVPGGHRSPTDPSKVATALTDDVFRAACKAEDDPAKVAGLINERLA